MMTGSTADGKAIVRNWLFQICLNGTLATESFVFVSGFLTTGCFVRRSREHGCLGSTLLLWFTRIWRTIPLLLAAVSLAILSPLTSSGPVWREMMHPYARNCRSNWPATVFAYSNFLKPEDAVSLTCLCPFLSPDQVLYTLHSACCTCGLRHWTRSSA